MSKYFIFGESKEKKHTTWVAQKNHTTWVEWAAMLYCCTAEEANESFAIDCLTHLQSWVRQSSFGLKYPLDVQCKGSDTELVSQKLA